jgi:membrane-bound acyltransferase YfiQ involved in biofilm formation
MGRMTIKFSRYSYTIYLLHILLIRAIYIVTESYFSNIAIGWVPLIVTPLIMIVFYVACTLYDKIKWLPNNLIGIG